MNYISLLTENEIQYICSAIPVKEVSDFFQRYPKEFAKILPGFRAATISQFDIDIGNLLFANRNSRFVSSFIEMNIEFWLRQIYDYMNQCMKDGCDSNTAYIQTLSQSFFADNVALYFKLAGEEHHESYISLLSSAVKQVRKVLSDQDKLYEDLRSKQSEIERLQVKLNTTEKSLDELREKQREHVNRIKTITQELAKADRMSVRAHEMEQIIVDLKKKIEMLEVSEHELSNKLSEVLTSQQQLEQQNRDDIEKQAEGQIKWQTASKRPLRPVDMKEYLEFLEYNLENIGVSRTDNYWVLLKQHLCEILFEGVPIIINKGVGVPLMQCVANALVGNMNVPTLTYYKDVTSEEIDSFLSRNSRVICLDGFLGNFNETELLALLKGRRNKIVFLTLLYDRTLYYIPREIFRYCRYLNLNRIQAFSIGSFLTEDPSEFEEAEFDVPSEQPDVRFSSLLREILIEIGFPQSMTVHICANIRNEQSLCGVLAFAVLPYCTDVMDISPFAISERLVKYAGRRGRCPYKALFKEWFI